MSLLKRLGGAAEAPTTSPQVASSAPAPAEETRQVLTNLAPPPPPPDSGSSGGISSLSALAPHAAGTGGYIAAPTQDVHQKMLEVSLWVVDKIQASLGSQAQLERTEETERMMQERFAAFYRQANVNFSQEQIRQLYQMVLDEMFGFGPLESLIRDDDVT